MIRTILQELRITLTWANNGLGKTFIGAERLIQYANTHSLVVCQKSKLTDWLDHFRTYYPAANVSIRLTETALEQWRDDGGIAIVNYDIIARRAVLRRLSGHCLLLDESSLIQNESAKRTKTVLSMNPAQVILLSGTPTGGKYEKLWTQMRLLGWRIAKQDFWTRYIEYRIWDATGFPVKIVTGYKNVDDLKQEMHAYGCRFLKAEEVTDELPSQAFTRLYMDADSEYRKMLRTGIAVLDGREILGETSLTERLYLRQLSTVGKSKLLADILASTDERIIVFYNFQRELSEAVDVCEDRPISYVNGSKHDLAAYEQSDNSVTLIQYQSGSMGLNLQKARIAVFMSPPESSTLYEQAKKRIHRIGQSKPCLYYQLIARGIEMDIYDALALRKDYTDELFKTKYGGRKNI